MQSQQPHDRRHLAWSIVSFIFGLSIVAVLVFQARPEYTALLIFGLSIIPTHILISPIAHEPIVFLYAKCFSPGLIAVTGGISCCVAGVFDYLALPKLIHHPAFRSRYENRPLYRKVQRLFCKSPFWFMTLASLTPLPHYPFKFLSIAGHYPLGKYTLAQLAGRIPRFYLLALFGYSMQFPAWVIVAILAVPIVFFLFNFISKKGDG